MRCLAQKRNGIFEEFLCSAFRYVPVGCPAEDTHIVAFLLTLSCMNPTIPDVQRLEMSRMIRQSIFALQMPRIRCFQINLQRILQIGVHSSHVSELSRHIANIHCRWECAQECFAIVDWPNGRRILSVVPPGASCEVLHQGYQASVERRKCIASEWTGSIHLN